MHHPCRHALALARIKGILAALESETPPPPDLSAREGAILAHWPRAPTFAADVVAALWPFTAPPVDDASRALREALSPLDGQVGGVCVPSVTSVGAQLRQLARRSPRVRSQAHPRLGVKLWWVTESTAAEPV